MALVAIATEVITVSTIKIGITPTLLVDTNGDPTRAIYAKFQHSSGGAIHTNPLNDPVQADGDDFKRVITSVWEVWGYDDMKNFQMIKQSGESDAEIVVHIFGEA